MERERHTETQRMRGAIALPVVLLAVLLAVLMAIDPFDSPSMHETPSVAEAVGPTSTSSTSMAITVPSSTLTSSTTTLLIGFGTTSTTLPRESECGDARGDGGVTATDALAILRTAVGLTTCQACICDTDSSGTVTAVDALRALRFAIGQPITLNCPAC